MKVAIILLVALGFVALSVAAPASQAEALAEIGEQGEEANSLIDPNCGKTATPGTTGSDTPDDPAQSRKSKKEKRGGGGKRDKKNQ